MKRIGFFIDNMGRVGGTERVTSMLSNGLCESYEIFIISAKEGDKSFYQLDKRVQLLSLHGERYTNYISKKIFLLKEIVKAAKERQLDILIAVDIAFYIYLFPVKLFGSSKVIAWEHFNFHAQKQGFARLSRYLAVKTADQVVVLGKKDFESYQSHFCNADNICYIYNPIHFPKKKAEIGSEAKTVLAVGRLEKQKGFDLLLSAWKTVGKESAGWTLKIIGEGSQKAVLEEFIQNNSLDNVKILPFTEEIEKHYLGASIFALSSRFEGFVLVLLEALSYGLPCVSFDCREGPAEIIEDGVNGFLVPDGDVEAFAQKLQFLMAHDELRVNFAAQSSYGLERFALRTVLKQWRRLFCTLTDSD